MRASLFKYQFGMCPSGILVIAPSFGSLASGPNQWLQTLTHVKDTYSAQVLHFCFRLKGVSVVLCLFKPPVSVTWEAIVY